MWSSVLRKLLYWLFLSPLVITWIYLMMTILEVSSVPTISSILLFRIMIGTLTHIATEHSQNMQTLKVVVTIVMNQSEALNCPRWTRPLTKWLLRIPVGMMKLEMATRLLISKHGMKDCQRAYWIFSTMQATWDMLDCITLHFQLGWSSSNPKVMLSASVNLCRIESFQAKVHLSGTRRSPTVDQPLRNESNCFVNSYSLYVSEKATLCRSQHCFFQTLPTEWQRLWSEKICCLKSICLDSGINYLADWINKWTCWLNK